MGYDLGVYLSPAVQKSHGVTFAAARSHPVSDEQLASRLAPILNAVNLFELDFLS